ncbi:hypothetical protein FIU97_05440 [Roseivivax sp. THAF40]|uniref:DUF934 domain-containing protein n=1 Tax=unclassified Roseivivax TaxID=2639302 RepID=UPI001267FD63|nr:MULTISPECIES: DUF934 domain-containing protein [unclassified Roseivivax]QFS82217.1 hypothetical protein FIV09_05180 [Roseivivax sp. THAF197b]QFT46017.1 hypothetical protein FIU97_05440 [Roseivivax sp. THAF40]
MSVIVTDAGFAPDDFQPGLAGDAVVLPSDTDPDTLEAATQAQMVVVEFPSSADGRGFTLARLLRLRGYRGRLRARGHVIADQYAMARRAGFDEVEIDAALAARQPEDQWIFRADWQSHDYQARLRG